MGQRILFKEMSPTSNNVSTFTLFFGYVQIVNFVGSNLSWCFSLILTFTRRILWCYPDQARLKLKTHLFEHFLYFYSPLFFRRGRLAYHHCFPSLRLVILAYFTLCREFYVLSCNSEPSIVLLFFVKFTRQVLLLKSVLLPLFSASS